MLALWLTAGVLGKDEAAPPVDVPSYGGGYGSPSRVWTPEEDERLERALRALDRSVRQARTPRVRQAKLSMAVEAAEQAMVLAPAPVLADLSEVHRLLIDIKAGFLAFPDWRAEIAAMIARAMEAAQIEADEDDEDAMWLLMMA
jgi:hypothetical protein